MFHRLHVRARLLRRAAFRVLRAAQEPAPFTADATVHRMANLSLAAVLLATATAALWLAWLLRLAFAA